MKHPLSSPAGHVRRRCNGNAPPPGVPLSAVPDPHLSSRGLCEMTRRHRRRRINALQMSINTSQTVAESAGRDARALRVRRAGWGLTRVDRPAPAPGPPGRRARVSCVRRPSSPRLETSRDVNVPTSDAHFFVRLASLWGTPSQLTALSSISALWCVVSGVLSRTCLSPHAQRAPAGGAAVFVWSLR